MYKAQIKLVFQMSICSIIAKYWKTKTQFNHNNNE